MTCDIQTQYYTKSTATENINSIAQRKNSRRVLSFCVCAFVLCCMHINLAEKRFSYYTLVICRWRWLWLPFRRPDVTITPKVSVKRQRSSCTLSARVPHAAQIFYLIQFFSFGWHCFRQWYSRSFHIAGCCCCYCYSCRRSCKLILFMADVTMKNERWCHIDDD